MVNERIVQMEIAITRVKFFSRSGGDVYRSGVLVSVNHDGTLEVMGPANPGGHPFYAVEPKDVIEVTIEKERIMQ